jgi:hypothetical protein
MPLRVAAAIGGALLAALTLAAPASVAHAQERKEIKMTLSPSTVTPGDQVRITAECGTSEATATSLAFPDQALKSSTSGMVEGEATVNPDTPPGTYAVNVQCTNENFGESKLVVVNDNTGVQTGDGSSLGGRSAALTATGAGLLTVAAIGLGTLAWRRRGTRRS